MQISNPLVTAGVWEKRRPRPSGMFTRRIHANGSNIWFSSLCNVKRALEGSENPWKDVSRFSVTRTITQMSFRSVSSVGNLPVTRTDRWKGTRLVKTRRWNFDQVLKNESGHRRMILQRDHERKFPSKRLKKELDWMFNNVRCSNENLPRLGRAIGWTDQCQR